MVSMRISFGSAQATDTTADGGLPNAPQTAKKPK
jgi:hypothetical protein